MGSRPTSSPVTTRTRPSLAQLLDEHFERLGLLDPERYLRVAIAGYPLTAIIDGIAIFEAKRNAKTLPEGVDGRYLLGIVRNLSSQLEGEQLARRLFALRLEARDAMLTALVAERGQLCANSEHPIDDCIDRALAVQSPLERSFWLDTAATLLRNATPSEHQSLFEDAARRLEASFRVRPRERHDAVRQLADQVVLLT